MTHTTDRLERLGRQHKKLTAQLAEIKPELEAEIRAAAEAGTATQTQICEWTGYKREWVRLAADPAKREARAARQRAARAAGRG